MAKRAKDPIGDLIEQSSKPRGFTGEDLRKEFGKRYKASALYSGELPTVSKKTRKIAQAKQKAAPNQETGYYNRGQRVSKNIEDATVTDKTPYLGEGLYSKGFFKHSIKG